MLDVSSEYGQASSGPSPSIMPLLDVMLLLLIFFLLASVFVQPTLEVDLPEAVNSDAAMEPEVSLTISVDAAGNIYINRMIVPADQLQSRIEAALAEEPDRPVMVRADQESAFKSFVTVMDAVRGAGGKQLVIETRGEAQENAP